MALSSYSSALRRLLMPALCLFAGMCAGYWAEGLIDLAGTSHALEETHSQRKARGGRVVRVTEYSRQERQSFSEKDLATLLVRIKSLQDEIQLKEEWEKMLRQNPNRWCDLSLLAMAEKWGELNPVEGMDLIEGLKKPWKELEYLLRSELLATWCQRDPVGASGYYMKERNRLYSDNYLVGDILRTWTKSSPGAAWEWFSSLDKNEKDKGLPAFLDSLAKNHPSEWVKYIDALESDMITPFVLNEIRSHWDTIEKGAYARWLRDNKEIDDTDRLIAEAFLNDMIWKHEGTFEKDFSILEKGTNRVLEIYGGDFPINLSFRETAERFRSGVSDNVSLLPEDVLWKWSESNPLQAREWIETLPEGDFRDEAVSRYIEVDPSPDYEALIRFAGSITDDEERSAALNRALRNWNRAEPEKARKWISENASSDPASLGEEAKE